jgi:hypothetical protein
MLGALCSSEMRVCDRTIMSPFINQQPFYPQTSLEKTPKDKFLCSKTAPPLEETALQALVSLTFLFYKSHAWPRFAAVSSSPASLAVWACH